MKPYPNHVTREQFEVIRPDLESFRGQTQPKTIDFYDIFQCRALCLIHKRTMTFTTT
jgi:hypothetical protein